MFAKNREKGNVATARSSRMPIRCAPDSQKRKERVMKRAVLDVIASSFPFQAIVAAMIAWCACAHAAETESTLPASKPEEPRGKIPVILDTDIGDDIDDTWALSLLLKSPELDVKLVVGDQRKSLYRARLIAKLLETAGRTDVPVGVGLGPESGSGGQATWIEGYDLKSYPGTVHQDGVKAIVDAIMRSPEPITLIATGPVPNVAAALEREPKIAQRARFVGMHGSVRRGYGGSEKVSAEYNVRADPGACQKVFTAPWDMTITPLDTCGLVHLTGDKYKAVRDSKDPVVAALIQNYRTWSQNKEQAEVRSSTLFDTVAVYLAFSHELVKIERLGIRVTDDGYTVIDPAAKIMSVAIEWKDMAAFEDLLVKRLTGPTVNPGRKL
jgi:inosine-uridine nucleoside N-ribohydrolase